MCDNNVGVAKRIEVERISKEIAELVKALDEEVNGDDVNIPVQKVKKVKEKLDKMIE
jgi:hypothetical protein